MHIQTLDGKGNQSHSKVSCVCAMQDAYPETRCQMWKGNQNHSKVSQMRAMLHAYPDVTCGKKASFLTVIKMRAMIDAHHGRYASQVKYKGETYD